MNTATAIILKITTIKNFSSETLNAVKRLVLRSQKTKTSKIPTSKELLKSYHNLIAEHKVRKNPALEKLLTKRAVRTLSGATIITVLTKPFQCPGKCIYCPDEEKMPKSYISDEPAAARALKLKFNPYEQTARRIKTLRENGHQTDKIELIVKGGTWNAYPLNYQYWFINECFRACNKGYNSKIINHKSIKLLRKKIHRTHNINETAPHRIIGLTLETRPDFINERAIKIMRELGCTRIELGVQTTDDGILKTVKRGHSVKQTKNATRMLKNAGFKVDYHLMPQLPGATPKKDLEMLLEIFRNPDLRPDMIKIYPCTVIKGTELYHWLKKGKYKPYSDKKLFDILVKFKSQIPRYVRVSRIIRDIPGHHVMAGNKVTNLRQVIQAEMKKKDLKCNCLRCREIGHVSPSPQREGQRVMSRKKKIKLFVDQYQASGGIEYFLSFEDKNREIVYAFCRLRIVSSRDPLGRPPATTAVKACRAGGYPLEEKPTVIKGILPLTTHCAWLGRNGTIGKAFIRELHTYGQTLNIGKRESKANQHKGMGKRLIEEAEKICHRLSPQVFGAPHGGGRKNKITELAVIAGVGVREYYRKLGYRLKGTYMVKRLD